MSIADRVFLLFGFLMIVMLGSQWFMMQSITTQVSSELGKVAFSVAKDTAGYFELNNLNWTTNNVQSGQSFNPEQTATMSGKQILRSTTTIQIRAPSVEVRINNQRTDDSIQLISGNRTTSVPLPRAEMNSAVEQLQQQMIISTLIILSIGLVLAAFLARRLMQPINRLSDAAKQLAQGSLGTQIQTKDTFTSPEISNSIKTFNDMSRQLAIMQRENENLLANAHYKELGYISSGLAHSIRNPLNTLGLTISQIVDKSVQAETSTELVNSAYRQINRIDNWVKTFMTFALGTDAETTDFKLKTVLQSIILESGQMHQSISIQSDLPDTVTIHGIEAEMHAIFHSVVINAVEASSANSRVVLSFEIFEDDIHCLVVDQGTGIPEAIQATLFQPHKTTKQKGSGMGLFMAQKLAENRYGGSICLVESSSTGTTIELRINKQRKL